ncbi:0e71b91b-1530-4634-b76f-cbf05c61e119 [Thermothielavioides terrestris]|uniref:0e71b91b-1530-4634-b76f-cbf05c61e119 n=1 Tax=Thermothielavioides terrestris TaxID=2587410 RepID=A0A3S4F2N4_9PEZI|nr:0e71b91b-1530-4634-b76f-cbf05c61e119 [Thermothielavioides terrestris]
MKAWHLLPLVALSPTVSAHPSHRTAGRAVDQLPPITTGPTSYPTTLSTTYTFTSSTGYKAPGAFQVFQTAIELTTVTVTIYEPWPSPPPSYPYTETLTQVSTLSARTLVQYDPSGPFSTFTRSSTVTVPATWVLRAPPAPTDLPADAALPARYALEGADVAMGRVCWGNGTLLEELLEPCARGDVMVGCVPCKGVDQEWRSYTLTWAD